MRSNNFMSEGICLHVRLYGEFWLMIFIRDENHEIRERKRYDVLSMNKEFKTSQTLTYVEFSNQFVYDREKKEMTFTQEKVFYCKKCCTIYESIRIVNMITYPSFQDAFYSLGLLYDNRKFITAINEVWSSIKKTFYDVIDI
ncbi:hypothetical protein Ahy_B07g087271 isoform A [Arachis hypogaea]|uniref:Uncharacterized protein n=1 Tax=Arachis hypogaea TaxID=3818 RepID=A0A444YBZ6_ARAHY|nr:hypothetical protein Ahy_B07g087271 isoform A [Arachis hypogaea]